MCSNIQNINTDNYAYISGLLRFLNLKVVTENPYNLVIKIY